MDACRHFIGLGPIAADDCGVEVPGGRPGSPAVKRSTAFAWMGYRRPGTDADVPSVR